VTVDVAGKVRRPGITVLDAGSRVVDAVKAAGGARRGVDLSSLNLARVLVDGEQIVVGGQAPVTSGVPTAPGGSAPVPGQLVNLNLASAVELEALPEVGPVTAAAIVSWRETNGAFSSVDELLEIDGIGEATLAQIAPYATV
jgi:competence protein ComEA